MSKQNKGRKKKSREEMMSSTEESYTDVTDSDQEESLNSDEVLPPTPPPKKLGRLNCVLFRKEKNTTTTKTSVIRKKKRVRKAVKCTICKKPQLNIWRHMKYKHPQSDNQNEKKEDFKRTSRGYIVRQCPVRNCNAVIERMSDHLKRKHKIAKGSRKLELMMSKAKPVIEKLPKVIVKEENDVIVIDSENSENSESGIDRPIKIENIKTEPTEPSGKKRKILIISSGSDSEMNPSVSSYRRKEVKKTRKLVSSDSETNVRKNSSATHISEKPLERKRKVVSSDSETDGFNPPKHQKITLDKPSLVSYSSVSYRRKDVKKTRKPLSSDSETNVQENSSATQMKRETENLLKRKRELVSSDSETDLFSPPKHQKITLDKPSLVSYSVSESETGTESDSSYRVYFSDVYIPESDSEDEEDDDEESAKQLELDKYAKKENWAVLKSSTEVTGFVEWLMGFPYLKEKKIAQQHASQMFNYWQFASVNMNISAFFEITALNGWITKEFDKKTPGTLRSYLGSIRFFVEYIILNDKIRQQEISRALRFKEHINVASKSLGKHVRRRKTEVDTEDLETMLLPEDFSEFKHSEVTARCERILLDDNPPGELVPDVYRDMRDFLLLRITQANAQRPMAVRGITEKAIKMARKSDDGGAVIAIPKHKTSTTGPAMLALDSKLFPMVNNFVKITRQLPQFKPDETRSIFVSWPNATGQCVPLTSSTVNKSLQRIWSQGPVGKKITATRIRKATTTAVRSRHPAARDVLAAHMTHTAQTADRYYKLNEQLKMAKPVSELITSVMDNEESTIEKNEDEYVDERHISRFLQQGNKGIRHSAHWPRNTNKMILPINNMGDEDDSDGNILKPSPLNEQNMALSGDDGRPNTPIQQEKKTHRRRSFSPEDSQLLLRLCEQNLLKGNVKKYDIMLTLQETAEGNLLLHRLKDKIPTENFWKVIVDRVHAERRRRERQGYASKN